MSALDIAGPSQTPNSPLSPTTSAPRSSNELESLSDTLTRLEKKMREKTFADLSFSKRIRVRSRKLSPFTDETLLITYLGGPGSRITKSGMHIEFHKLDQKIAQRLLIKAGMMRSSVEDGEDADVFAIRKELLGVGIVDDLIVSYDEVYVRVDGAGWAVEIVGMCKEYVTLMTVLEDLRKAGKFDATFVVAAAAVEDEGNASGKDVRAGSIASATRQYGFKLHRNDVIKFDPDHAPRSFLKSAKSPPSPSPESDLIGLCHWILSAILGRPVRGIVGEEEPFKARCKIVLDHHCTVIQRGKLELPCSLPFWKDLMVFTKKLLQEDGLNLEQAVKFLEDAKLSLTNGSNYPSANWVWDTVAFDLDDDEPETRPNKEKEPVSMQDLDEGPLHDEMDMATPSVAPARKSSIVRPSSIHSTKSFSFDPDAEVPTDARNEADAKSIAASASSGRSLRQTPSRDRFKVKLEKAKTTTTAPTFPTFQWADASSDPAVVEEIRKVYVHIDKNVRVGGAKGLTSRKEVADQCQCIQDNGKCEEGCVLRESNIECGLDCEVGEECHNRRLQLRQNPKTEIYRAGKFGFGLRVLEDVAVGDIVLEYVGELIDKDEFQKRVEEYNQKALQHRYFAGLRNGELLDSMKKGNSGRFLNHHCEPNCQLQSWVVGNTERLAFVAVKELKAGDEANFDYGDGRLEGVPPQICLCGAERCWGMIWEDRRKLVRKGSDVKSLKKDRSLLRGGLKKGKGKGKAGVGGRDEVEEEGRQEEGFQGEGPSDVITRGKVIKAETGSISSGKSKASVLLEKFTVRVSQFAVEENYSSFEINELGDQSSQLSGRKGTLTQGM
ncbi:histone methyltransferase set2 [Rhizophlyctis rosea]|nr:histone methyltransferase set2 [Rhizophlyctis rosea]